MKKLDSFEWFLIIGTTILVVGSIYGLANMPNQGQRVNNFHQVVEYCNDKAGVKDASIPYRTMRLDVTCNNGDSKSFKF